MTRFDLQPMDRVIRWVTLACGLLMAGLLAGSLFLPPLLIPGLLLVLLTAVIWVWYRPSYLEAGPEGVHVVWPWRRRVVLRGQIVSAQRTSLVALSPMLRVGVGGLFGVFGSFWRPGKGWVLIYCTAMNDLVLLERKGERPLLLSPADPEGFLKSLGLGPGE